MSNPVNYGVERVSERMANYGAVGAATSHWWLPSVHQVSEWASDLLPIVGLSWLLFQFGLKIYDRWYLKEKEED